MREKPSGNPRHAADARQMLSRHWGVEEDLGFWQCRTPGWCERRWSFQASCVESRGGTRGGYMSCNLRGRLDRRLTAADHMDVIILQTSIINLDYSNKSGPNKKWVIHFWAGLFEMWSQKFKKCVVMVKIGIRFVFNGVLSILCNCL